MNFFTLMTSKFGSLFSMLFDYAVDAANHADWPIIGSIMATLEYSFAHIGLGIDSVGVSACHNMAYDINDLTFIKDVKDIVLLQSEYGGDFNIFKTIDGFLSSIIPVGVSLAVIFFLVSILSDATKDNSTLEHYIKETIKLVVVITAISLSGDIVGSCIKFSNYAHKQLFEKEETEENLYLTTAKNAMKMIYGEDGEYHIPKVIDQTGGKEYEFTPAQKKEFSKWMYDSDLTDDEDDDDMGETYISFWPMYLKQNYPYLFGNFLGDLTNTDLSFTVDRLALAYLLTHFETTLKTVDNTTVKYTFTGSGGRQETKEISIFEYLQNTHADADEIKKYNKDSLSFIMKYPQLYINLCTDIALITKQSTSGIPNVDVGKVSGLFASNGYFMLMIKLFVPWIVSLATSIVIYFVAMQRLISIAWRIIFMPIGLANAFDGPILSTAGFRYIKSFLSVCLSGVLLIVILYIGNKLTNGVKAMVESPILGILCMKLAMVGAALGSENRIKEVLGG